MDKRAWLRDPAGEWHVVPYLHVGEEQVPWPFTLQEITPVKPVRYLKPSDWYQRHEVGNGAAFVYLAPGVGLGDIPADEIDHLLEGM